MQAARANLCDYMSGPAMLDATDLRRAVTRCLISERVTRLRDAGVVLVVLFRQP